MKNTHNYFSYISSYIKAVKTSLNIFLVFLVVMYGCELDY